MQERISVYEFDILGIFSLKDVEGIEEYVTKIEGTDKYLSRSKEYYNVKTMKELSAEREKLKNMLTREKTKRNFVILENMLNCSGRVFFKKFEEMIRQPDDKSKKDEYERARKCMIEDSKNIVAILSQTGVITTTRDLMLPEGEENALRRAIEMDNKAILYMFCNALNLATNKRDTIILTPGYGSIYIGPFLHAIHGVDFANMLKSKYIQETTGILEQKKITQLVSTQELFNRDKQIVILDDNIGTGSTINEIKQMLEEVGITPKATGAVQYNWRNYYRVSTGQKTDVERFEISGFDILTPINYAGHKLYKHAIDMLHSSSTEYEQYLRSKAYRKDEISDTEGAVLRGIKYAKRAGINLINTQYTQDEQDEQETLPIIPKYKDKEQRMKDSAQQTIMSIVEKLLVEKEEHNREETR